MVGQVATAQIPESGSRELTDVLGCSHTTVKASRLLPDEPLSLTGTHEQLIIPIDTTELLAVDGVDIPPIGVAFAPVGLDVVVTCRSPVSILIISTPGDPTSDAVSVNDLEDASFPLPTTSDVGTERLTRALGCTGMKVNARRLNPGQHVPYHTEGEQEELFIPVQGPARMRFAGEERETPVGSVTRVPPAVPRSAKNTGDEPAVWVMIGAPPTGGPEEWDPGATILE